MRIKGCIAAVLAASVCIGVAVGPVSASARVDEQVFSYDLPRQLASTSLIAFAETSKVRMAAASSEIAGISTNAVKGRYTPPQALALLLQGTPLEGRFDGAGTVVTVTRRNSVAAESAAAAPAIAAAVAPTRARGNPEVASSASIPEEVVVTAQRREESIADVPISISAISGDQLAMSGVSNNRELTFLVPGLVFVEQGVNAQPAIRGVSSQGSSTGQDNNIAIYIDGVYQPSQTANAFDLPDVKRVEVLRGPQGTLFGRNATGGAVQVVTRDPEFDTEGQLSVSLGALKGGARNVAAKGFVTGGLVEDRVAGMLSFSYQDREAFLDNIISGDALGVKRTKLLRGKLMFTPRDDLTVTLTGNYSDRRDDAGLFTQALDGNTQARALTPTITLPSEPWQVAFNRPTFYRNKSSGGDLRIVWDTSAGRLTSLTSYLRSRTEYAGDLDASSSTRVDQSVLIYPGDTTKAQEINFASETYGALSYVAGLYLYDSRGVNTSGRISFGNLTSNRLDQVDTRAYAGYSEVNYDLTERLVGIVGLRYSRETKVAYRANNALVNPTLLLQGRKTWSSSTPRASLRYAVNDRTNAYLTISSGFKSGVFDSSQPLPASPEELVSYEIGVKGSGPGFSYGAAAYLYDYKDLQVQSFDGSVTRIRNATDAEVVGFEFEGKLMVTDHLSIGAHLAYMPTAEYTNFPGAFAFSPTLVNGVAVGGNTGRTFDASGLRMVRAPKLTGGFSLDYDRDLAAGNLHLSASFYHSDRFNHDLLATAPSPAYEMVNASAAWSPVDTGFTLTLWGRNLTNEARVGGASISPIASIVTYGLPREYGITMGYRF